MIELGEAVADADRRAVYRFWYSVYVAELGRYVDLADHDATELRGPEDATSRIFFARDGDEVVGACRINLGSDGFTERQIRQYGLEPFLRELPHEQLLVGERTMVASAYRGSDVYTQVAMQVGRACQELPVEVSFGASEPHLVSYYAKFDQRPFATRQYMSEESGYIVPTVCLVHGVEPFGNPLPDCIRAVLENRSSVRNADIDGVDRYRRAVRSAVETARGPGSLFEAMSDDEIEQVCTRGTLLTCHADDQVLRVGGTALNPFVLMSGAADVRRDRDTMYSLSPGDLFGESGWIAGTPRRSDVVVTTTGTRILALSLSQLARIEREAPAIASKLHGAVARQLWPRLDAAGLLAG